MDLIELAFLEELEDHDEDWPPPVPVGVGSFTYKSRRTQFFYETCTDYEFLRNFRFDKAGALHLTSLLEAKLTSPARGGWPLTPQDIVLIGLNILSGGHFLRTGALLADVSYYAALNALHKFCVAVNELKSQVLHLPSLETMYKTSKAILEKYHLPGFAFAVDGVHIFLDEKPRNILEERIAQVFFGRKLRYAVNAQVIGGPDDRLIYDLNLGSPGSFSDSTTWRCSDVKGILEGQHPKFLLAGDSGYPKSKLLVTPFSNDDALGDANKRLFNLRLSGLRAEGSENIFGVWKRRWPIIKQVRFHHSNAIEVVLATAVLHNLSVLWKQPEWTEEDDDDIPPEFRNSNQGQVRVEDDLDRAAVRAEGEIVRNNLLANMPPPTAKERKQLAKTS